MLKVATVLSLLSSVTQIHGKVIAEKWLVDKRPMTWPILRGGARAPSYSQPPRISHVAYSRFFDRGEVPRRELTRFAAMTAKRERLLAELQSEYETIKNDPELQAELSQLAALTAKRERLSAELQSKYEAIASRVAEREKEENNRKREAIDKIVAGRGAGVAWPKTLSNGIPAYSFQYASGTFDPLQIYNTKLFAWDFQGVVTTMALASLICSLAAVALRRFSCSSRNSGEEPLMQT